MKKTLAIDFDGTIVEHAWPRIGALKKGAKEAITRLYSNYTIIIWTARNNPSLGDVHKSLAEVEKFLKDNNIPFDHIDDGKNGKLVADYYIDDRAIEFRDNWTEIAGKL